jgi:hypothetical protein
MQVWPGSKAKQAMPDKGEEIVHCAGRARARLRSTLGSGSLCTAKGYINRRAVLARRASIVDSLYCEPAAPDVVVLGQNRTSVSA